MEIKTKAVMFCEEGIQSAREIGEKYNISERTVRRWAKSHRLDEEGRLRPKKPGPKRSPRATSLSLEQRIIRPKKKYPAWGARRIKHQFDLPCSWRTVHTILKRHGLLIRVNAKPQHAGKQFQRFHIESMWQGDTFQFRIRGSCKVYITGFSDDCLRFRVKCNVYLHKDAISEVRRSSQGTPFRMDFPGKSTSIMENSSSPKHSKLNLRKKVSNLFSADHKTHVVAVNQTL